MRRLLLIPLILLVAACTQGPPTTSVTVTADTADASIPAPIETIDVTHQNSVSHDVRPVVPDSSLYIGEVHTFSETGELYTPAYYHDHLTVDGLYEKLTKQTDSLIFEDIERRRSRIPSPIAENHFNLSGLDTISVYKSGRLAGRAKFIRVEHFHNVIESQFIAVFEPIGSATLPDELDYCISTQKNPYKTVDVTYEEIEDDQLTKTLLETFVRDSMRVWNVLHTRIMPYQSVYSAISMHSRFVLVETNEGQSRILKDLKEDWFISDITPLHLEANGKPILLLTMGINETDMIWTSLAVFSGMEYVFPENNRLKRF